ncbi:DNA methyltransferase [Kamptonema cortianum]|nr:DNA methyltransferase [Geitlerinema splendidum]MDK3155332.1 DNA methyltransferase [Kamptonema cortianum]
MASSRLDIYDTTGDKREIDGSRDFTKSHLNRLSSEDRAVHDWYRFVLSFPPHLVRCYLNDWGIGRKDRVLDPFCGTGTTPVECKMLGIESLGVEANPMTHFASQTKVNWTLPTNRLLETACRIYDEASDLIERDGISYRKLPPESDQLMLKNSISPLPLHKLLTLKHCLERNESGLNFPHLWLALAKVAVGTASNLRFGPEVGVGPQKLDADVLEAWLETVRQMAVDISRLDELACIPSEILQADARNAHRFIPEKSIDAVFTSPPYPNEKDYSRTTRLESVLLGYVSSKEQLREIKKGLLRSNTRGVYKGDDDDRWVDSFPSVQELAATIEARRVALGKTSGFERLYARVTKLYFGGMARHLAEIRPLLKPGARLGYVVGDQASYLRVMIRTGQILAEIAESLGYRVVSIDLFRTRLATATKEMMREEVLVLEWKGEEGRYESLR